MAKLKRLKKNEKFKAAVAKEQVTDRAWRQLNGFIAYADGIIERDGFEAIFDPNHENHKKWKREIVEQSIEYSNGLAVKSMPTVLEGSKDAPIRLIYRASSDKAE
jgi:hypothetical protein